MRDSRSSKEEKTNNITFVHLFLNSSLLFLSPSSFVFFSSNNCCLRRVIADSEKENPPHLKISLFLPQKVHTLRDFLQLLVATLITTLSLKTCTAITSLCITLISRRVTNFTHTLTTKMLPKIAILLLVTTTTCLAQYNDDYQQQQEPAQPARGGGGGYQEGVQENENSAGGGNGIEPLDPSVPEPPSQIPETSFVCDGKPYDPGMYADEETNCRVYHMCYRGRKESFICGTGTVFNQEILSCDYPDNVDCAQSQSFYSANTELGKSSPEPASGGGGGAQTPTQPRPRPSGPRPGATGGGGQQQPDTSFGGAQDAGGDVGEDGYDQPQGPAPVPRPRPNVRPSAGGKTPAVRPPPPAPAPRPDYGGTAPAPRPVQRPQKTNVRPRPAAGGQRPRPQQPRPAERPIVQSNQELSLDYEPSSQVIQRRSSRQLSMTRRNPSKRWQMYSQDS